MDVYCGDFTKTFIWLIFILYLAALIVSVVLWAIYEEDKENQIPEAVVAGVIGVVFAILIFWYFKPRCDVVAPLLILIYPLFIVIFQYTKLDASMLSPLSYGWTSAKNNNWKMT